MAKQLSEFKIGAVIEVRDSRAPLSCTNWKFEKLLADPESLLSTHPPAKRLSVIKNGWGEPVGRPVDKLFRLLVLNKSDRVRGGDWKRLLADNYQRFAGIPAFFTSKTDTASIDAVLMHVIKIWVNHHRPVMMNYPNTPYPPLNLMVVGLPNTGKSSIINRFRVQGLGMGDMVSGKVASVSKDPGCTRALSGSIKIIDTTRSNAYDDGVGQRTTKISRSLRSNNVRLKVYVMDSPGILMPFISDEETALRLSLINCIPTNAGAKRGMDPIKVAQFLLERIKDRWGCADHLEQKFGRPINDINDLISTLVADHRTLPATHESARNATIHEGAAMKFLRMWRDGELCIDNDWRRNIVDDLIYAGAEPLEAWFRAQYLDPPQ
jgi:ribosome biogenesis GTPase A